MCVYMYFVRSCLNDCNSVLQLDPSNIQAWKCQLNAFAAMEMWTQGREVLDTAVLNDTETLKMRFLDCDIEFFQARRIEFANQAQVQAEREAQHTLEQTEKERKVQVSWPTCVVARLMWSPLTGGYRKSTGRCCSVAKPQPARQTLRMMMGFSYQESKRTI